MNFNHVQRNVDKVDVDVGVYRRRNIFEGVTYVQMPSFLKPVETSPSLKTVIGSLATLN